MVFPPMTLFPKFLQKVLFASFSMDYVMNLITNFISYTPGNLINDGKQHYLF